MSFAAHNLESGALLIIECTGTWSWYGMFGTGSIYLVYIYEVPGTWYLVYFFKWKKQGDSLVLPHVVVACILPRGTDVAVASRSIS